MKHKWEEPKIVVEQFAANEYVAACGTSKTYLFECNAGDRNKQYAVKDAKGNVATISGKYMNGWKHYYHPCGETHEAESDSGFLTGYHLDDPRTQQDENISVIIWTNYNTNVHCTTNLDMKEWEVARS